MSNDMISVPRELLAEMLDAMQPIYSLPPQYYGSTLGDRVRALLAQPNTCTKDGEPAPAPEPVWLWTAPDGHFGWTDRWDVAKHLPFELTKLYRNPPAQAPVVLPERKSAANFIGYRAYESAVLARGWNEYDDEFKRLNPTL